MKMNTVNLQVFLIYKICDSKIQKGCYSLRTLEGGKNKCELVACIRLLVAFPDLC